MTDDVRAGFIRQRRNLFVISLVLLFAQLADLTVNELDVFGTKIKIGSPVAVDFALWTAWVYWFIRYYVYFHDLGHKGFDVERYKALTQLLEKDTDKLLAANLASQKDFQCSKKDIRVSYHTRHVGQTTIEGGEPRWRVRVTNCSVTCNGANGPLASHPVYEVFVTNKLIARYKRKALWHVLIHTRLATEYGLPFVVAALPFLYFVGSEVCGLLAWP
jgi:hypothetical protein